MIDYEEAYDYHWNHVEEYEDEIMEMVSTDEKMSKILFNMLVNPDSPYSFNMFQDIVQDAIEDRIFYEKIQANKVKYGL